MPTAFVKMHGNGNDFVLLDNREGTLRLDPQRVRRLADRRLGIGCDQVLVAERPRNGRAVASMRIFNADGSSAGQCGNGLRCFARYVRGLGVAAGDVMAIETPGGVVEARLLTGGRVRAAMGAPRLEPSEIPLAAPRRAPTYALQVDGGTVEAGAVSMGNPHAVLTVPDVDTAPVTRLGPAIQALVVFPEGVNVGFMQVLARDHVRLRVFERGVGETLACGSGACAAAVCGRLRGLLDARVRVTLPGGDVHIEWDGAGHDVWMEGPTAHAFSGETEL